jgi:hypothetical protein
MSTGLNGLGMTASQDLKDVTNIHEASLGARSNETSGVAIRARQQEGATGTFLYIDNLRRAISYAGRVLVDLIPKVYDGERIVRVLKEDGSSEMKTINGFDPNEKPKIGPDGMPLPPQILDLSLGEYDVVVSTGQGYLTRREERREALINLTQAIPGMGETVADLLVDALDFPGGDEISKRLKAKMGIGEDGEPIQQQPPPPDPSVVAKALADGAKADLTKAQTEGQEIKNATDFVNLQAMMAGIGQQMQMLQQGMAQMMAMQGQGGPQGGGPLQQPTGLPQDSQTSPGGPGGPPQGMEMPEGIDAGQLVDMPEGAMLNGGGEGELVDMPEGAPI